MNEITLVSYNAMKYNEIELFLIELGHDMTFLTKLECQKNPTTYHQTGQRGAALCSAGTGGRATWREIDEQLGVRQLPVAMNGFVQ